MYRPEIDGLRALAVLPVVLYHAGAPGFGGGFIGVDVFFVISGYLITRLIVNDLEARRFSLADFYARRCRRLLPALCVMLAFCVPAACMWLSGDDAVTFFRSLSWAAALSSNLLFWRLGGYFATSADLQPLLHTWSLSVEEHFYLLYPLVLVWLHRRSARLLGPALLLMTVLSLVAAHWTTPDKPQFSFMLLPTRLWELSFGGWLSLARPARWHGLRRRSMANQVLSCAGVGLLAVAFWRFNASTSHPGLATAVPVAGASLILAFARRGTWIQRVLSHPAPVMIGSISYSLYLWHQPLLAFARHRLVVPPTLPTLLLVCALATALAVATWRWVEQPCRRAHQLALHQWLLLAVVSMSVLMLIGVAGTRASLVRAEEEARRSEMPRLTDAVPRARCDGPGVDHAAHDAPCRLGPADTRLPTTAAVFGDSHSFALAPAFDALAIERGTRIVHQGLEGCPPLLNIDVREGVQTPGTCAAQSTRAFELVQRNRSIRHVFLVARWSLYVDRVTSISGKRRFVVFDPSASDGRQVDARLALHRALESTVAAYAALGVQVHIVEEVPTQRMDMHRLRYRLDRFTTAGSHERAQALELARMPRSEHEAEVRAARALMRAISRPAGVNIVDLTDMLCDVRQCPAYDGEHWLYWDSNHLSTTGALRVLPRLRILM
ncbi:acyltransferase family protein [Ideonella sp. DXS22W]|uniref:Acyltransferase family protein n=1 Tax=Pseudaquabacterium inlustre TaxID=2984192 RepID=A0ABU9CFA7_9BURK